MLIFFLNRARREGPHAPPLSCPFCSEYEGNHSLQGDVYQGGQPIRAAISSLPAQIIGGLEMGKIFGEFTIQALGAHSTKSSSLSEAGGEAGSEAAGAPEAGKQSFSIPTWNEGEEGS